MSDGHLFDPLVAALDELGQGIAIVDLETQRYVSVNEALAQMCGYAREELLAMPDFFALLTSDEAGQLEPELALRAAGRPVRDRFETRLIRKDGQTVDIEVSIKPLVAALPGNQAVALVRDVTEQHRREQEVVAAEQRYRTLVERLPVVTYVAEPGEGGRWIYVSPQIETLFGYPAQEWIDDPTLWSRLVHPDDRERVFAAEDRLGKGERLPLIEYRMLTRTGAVLWISDDAVLRSEAEDGTWYLDGLLVDITDRKVAEARLQHLADHDALTGLLNRRRFIEDLTLELALIRRSARESSVVVVDVDNFKEVNDSLGHHAGDQLIRSVASLLGAQLREADTIARLGGDEFAILLRGTTGEPALVVAERLIEAVREHHFAVASDPVRVTVSGGIATVERGQRAAEECLVGADLAMYESKQTGRDRLAVFSPALRTDVEQRRTWADRIRYALENDEMLLFQQPILDLRDDRVSQYELLVRMRREDGRGVIAPQEFLPVAERFDLVQALDRWVVARAIRLIAAAERVGRDLVLEVNLSGRSIGDPALFELLESDLRTSGIQARNLILEVTETAAIENMEIARTFADQLAALGCRLALDDFGSGFGSFYYLKHLPFDYLKIDGDFVRQLTSNPVDQAVVRSIVQIAASVGYETIAEFVGDQPTLEAVRTFGVHFAQGYHVGAPEPVEALGIEEPDTAL
jgi:diguanylate cyclase (GGDEF)-like protein/PAS domain S-box-containing protein